MVKDIFRQVYPFTTENLDGYFPYLDLKNKSVLTVGSSLDQAFNALVYGARYICVYDINKYVADFYNYKKNLVLTKDRNEFCEAVFECDMPIIKWHPSLDEYVFRNTYLQSDYNYNLLRYRLEEDNISFIIGDIYELDKYLGNSSYDRILFSNILAYIDYSALERDIEDELFLLKDRFDSFLNHLNNDGLLQLMYYYNSVMNGNTTSDWNHGGKGSGYNTASDARQAFRNATSVDDAIKALVLGYVRPTGGINSYKNRAKVAEQIYKLISKQ